MSDQSRKLLEESRSDMREYETPNRTTRRCCGTCAFLSAFVLASAIQIAAAPSPTPGRAGVPIAYFSETQAQLPDGLYYKQATHPFEVTNTGTAPLTLKVTKRSCSCVAGETEATPIAPGEKRVLNIGYRAPKGREKHGPQEFTVQVDTNAPDTPSVTLSVKMRLVNPVDVTPSALDFGVVAPGDHPKRELIIDCYRDGTIPDITRITPSSPVLSIAPIGEETSDVATRRRYEVTLKKDRPFTVLESSIVIASTSDYCPTQEVRVSAQTAQALSVQPKVLLYGVVPIGETRTKTVKLSSGGAPNKVPRSATCKDARIRPTIEASPDGTSWVLAATLAAAEPAGAITTDVDILDAQGETVGAVPVYATVAGATGP